MEESSIITPKHVLETPVAINKALKIISITKQTLTQMLDPS
jgi:hypothetical protein